MDELVEFDFGPLETFLKQPKQPKQPDPPEEDLKSFLAEHNIVAIDGHESLNHILDMLTGKATRRYRTSRDAVEDMLRGKDAPSFREDVLPAVENLIDPPDLEEFPSSVTILVPPLSQGRMACHSIGIVSLDHLTGEHNVLWLLPHMLLNFWDALERAMEQIATNCETLCGDECLGSDDGPAD